MPAYWLVRKGQSLRWSVAMRTGRLVGTLVIKLNAIALAAGAVAGWKWIAPGWPPTGKGWTLMWLVIAVAPLLGLFAMIYANAQSYSELGRRWRLVNVVSGGAWLASAALLPQQLAIHQSHLNDFRTSDGEMAAALGLVGLIVFLVMGFVLNLGVMGCCSAIGWAQSRGFGPPRQDP